MGFYNEHQRPDRDKYVKINRSNIIPGTEYHFDKVRTSLTFGVPYDGLSIMHFKSYFFGKGGGKSTITSLVIIHI